MQFKDLINTTHMEASAQANQLCLSFVPKPIRPCRVDIEGRFVTSLRNEQLDEDQTSTRIYQEPRLECLSIATTSTNVILTIPHHPLNFINDFDVFPAVTTGTSNQGDSI